jgi:hypothetical protein
MKKYLLTTVIAGVLAMAATTTSLGQSLSDLQGKWELKKKTARFGDATQTIEIKDQKFTYKVVSKDGETLLFAKGKVKVEKLGPFNVVKLTDIEGGRSETDLQAVDDERTIVYATGENSLSFAMNFDRSREGEETECNTYTKKN